MEEHGLCGRGRGSRGRVCGLQALLVHASVSGRRRGSGSAMGAMPRRNTAETLTPTTQQEQQERATRQQRSHMRLARLLNLVTAVPGRVTGATVGGVNGIEHAGQAAPSSTWASERGMRGTASRTTDTCGAQRAGVAQARELGFGAGLSDRPASAGSGASALPSLDAI